MKTLSLFIFTILFCGSSFSKIIYVNSGASGMNDGSSWTDAFTDLHSALNASLSGDQIWIAKGIYKPSQDTDRRATFSLNSGVALYGGFLGTELELTQRDWKTNVTVLSGDIGIQGDSTDNTKVIVYCKNTSNGTILDGFTIAGSYSMGKYLKDSTGAVYLSKGSVLMINNSSFIKNSVDYGPGIYVDSLCSLTINYCEFSNNYSFQGTIYITYQSTLTIDSCQFTNNTTSTGGAIYSSDGCIINIMRSVVSDNKMNDEGAIYSNTDSIINISGSSFSNNISLINGASITTNFTPIEISSCSFLKDSSGSGSFGSAIYSWGQAKITNCTFRQIKAYSATIALWEKSEVRKCIFEDNTYRYDGGGIRSRHGLIVDSCTFINNKGITGGTIGGGMSVYDSLILSNSVFSGNTASFGAGFR